MDELEEVFRQHIWDEGAHEALPVEQCTECRKAILALIEQEKRKAQIEELEKLHRYDGKDYDTELDEVIDGRLAELKQAVEE